MRLVYLIALLAEIQTGASAGRDSNHLNPRWRRSIIQRRRGFMVPRVVEGIVVD